MVSVMKKRRINPETTHTSEAFSDARSANANSGGQMGDEEIKSFNNAGNHSTSSKQQKQWEWKGTEVVVSEQEKTQAESDIYDYKSNMFRMETEELLKEVRLDYQKCMAPVEKVLHKLRGLIETIPERLDIPIDEVEKEMKKRKINIPFPDPKPTKDVMYKFSYAKPSYINIVGSYALKTVVKQNGGFSIDLVISMPSSIFQEKDYLNHRYFHKRAYYLACLAAGIQESKDLTIKLAISYINDDFLRPILVVSPSGDDSELDFTASKCLIKLIPAVSRDTFVTSKLLPSRNCVRPTQASKGDNEKPPSLDPTPLYNSSLLADTTYFPHLSQLHASSEACSAFKGACVLGRVWLQQRGFGGDASKGGFGHFEWAILISFLLKGGGSKGHNIVSPGYSNYQIFKTIIQLLATRDLVLNPLVFNAGEEAKNKCSKLPVLFDGSNGLNLLFKMTPWSYKLLKHEATVTMRLLNDTASDNFDAIFLSRVDMLYSRFDSIACIPIPATATEVGSVLVTKNPDCTNHIRSYSQRLYEVLVKGLGDRISLVHMALPPPAQQNIDLKKPIEVSEERHIIVGFLLNAEQYARVVDHGPPAEHKKEAAEYRRFWGPKADLRRFKDGSILESVIWSEKDSKVPIFNQVIQYIVGRHVGVEIAKNTTFIGDEFLRLLPKSQVSGTQTTALFQPVMSGFDLLVKDLRSLEGLPLQIRKISATASSLRYSTVQVPLVTTNGQSLMDPANVVVQFESSLRWPEDLIAVQKAKIAFLLRIAELLDKTKGESIFTRIGLENESLIIMNGAFLDIVYLTGAAFRVRIYHDREQTLLERQLKDSSLSPHLRVEIGQALSEYCRSFIYGPLHTQDLQKLCHRFPALSPTIRLVKKWFQSHLLSPHVSEELMELMTLRCFVNPSPWAIPSSVMTGFLRTILFLSQWNWKTEPLVVDMSTDNLTTLGMETILRKFETLRKNDPALNRIVMFVASNHDQEGIVWTGNGPAKVVAARMTALARSAWEIIKNGGLTVNIGSLFVSSLKDYDFVLHLNPNFTAAGIRLKEQRQSKFKNLQKPEVITRLDIAKLGLDPMQMFLSELLDIYGDNIIYFYDSSATTTVGCLWNPLYTSVRGWKVNLMYSTIPVVEKRKVQGDDEEKPKFLLNKEAILNEITRLGGELVAKIDVNRP